jgi:hypothetical protein
MENYDLEKGLGQYDINFMEDIAEAGGPPQLPATKARIVEIRKILT